MTPCSSETVGLRRTKDLPTVNNSDLLTTSFALQCVTWAVAGHKKWWKYLFYLFILVVLMAD